MIFTAKVKNLRAYPIIGVYDFEKEAPQPIIINIAMTYEASKAVASDDILDTVNYCDMSQDIVKAVNATKFELLEKLVDFVLKIVMQRDGVISCEVEIDKVAPITGNLADFVSVTGTAAR